MAKTIIALLVLGFSISTASAFGCQTDNQKHQAALMLYGNKELRGFVCGDESCDEETMERYLDYRIEKLKGTPANLCFVTTSASVKNRYQAIFSFDERKVRLQLVVFANDIKIRNHKGGRTTIDAFQLTDDADGGGVVTSFRWNGKRFEQTNQIEVPSFIVR
ncbi:hypothetical protein [Trinickia sp. Y13]|uniref:hypothetical protein n=1 Tax=Trinickia sp. Y13 TaxID=2917807 RepID=UPI002405A8D4|nr:hypothetical protein [Trinickia sp. Y13]MDG0024913.1 hypothetical protein [Trinickia sp. Y13]